MVKKLFLFSLVIVISVFDFSYAQQGKIDALVKEVLEISGAKKQIQQIPEMVKSHMAQRQGETDPKVYETIRKIMIESYQADALYQAVAESLQKKFDAQSLSAVLQWHRSPLSRKITQLEVQSSSPKALQEMQQFAAQLQNKPPAQGRLALVQKLDQLTGSSELSIEMALTSFRAMAKAFDPVLPQEKRLKPGQLEEIGNTMRRQLEVPLKNQTLIVFLFTYRSLPDSELKQYVDFVESDPGRWFHKVMNESFLYAMTAAAERASKEIIKNIPPTTGDKTPT